MRIAIIGGGSWGTALALVLARRHDVSLWVHDAALAARMRDSRVNDVYLPEFPLPSTIHVGSTLAGALDGVEIVILVAPSEHCRGIFGQIRPHLQPNTRVVSATKGLEAKTLLTMSQMMLADHPAVRVGVLSGPSFAHD